MGNSTTTICFAVTIVRTVSLFPMQSYGIKRRECIFVSTLSCFSCLYFENLQFAYLNLTQFRCNNKHTDLGHQSYFTFRILGRGAGGGGGGGGGEGGD